MFCNKTSSLINKKTIILSIFVFLISLIVFTERTFAVTLPSTNVDINTNLPSDLYDPTTGEPVTVNTDSSNSIFDNSGGTDSNLNLPIGAEEQTQKLIEAAKVVPSSNIDRENASSSCNCPFSVNVFNFICPLRCFIIDIFNAISSVAINMGYFALNFVIGGENNTFAGLGFTTNDNIIIQIGWNVVRNVANAALVLGLVAIAISIILGLQENKSKQALITFILIALLINFTPVICGFIITGSNILMNSFLTGGVDSTYAVGVDKAFKIIKSANGETHFIQQAMYSIALLLFSLLFFAILVLYALLFAIRNIVLWILVILSPIAFATKVFPEFKHIKSIFPSVLHWDDWWDSFWQWCVIGIPAGLSIYLANQLMFMLAKAETYKSMTAMNSGIFQFLILYSIPFIFLLAGFMISISSGGKLAGPIGGFAAGLGAAALSRMGGVTKTKEGWQIKGGLAGAVSTAPKAVVGGALGLYEGATANQGIINRTTGALTGAAGGAFTSGGREKVLAGYHKRLEQVGLERKGAYEAGIGGEVSKAQKDFEHVSDDTLHEIAQGKNTIPTLMSKLTKEGAIKKAAVFNELAKRKELEEPEIEYLAKNVGTAKSFNVNLKDVAKGNPDYAPSLTGKSIDETVSGLTPKKAGETIYSSAYSRPEALKSIMNVHPQIIRGKLTKGNRKDLDNIRTGYIRILQGIPAFQGMTIDPNDLETFATSNFNQITNYIQGTTNGTPQEQATGRALEELTDLATNGEI